MSTLFIYISGLNEYDCDDATQIFSITDDVSVRVTLMRPIINIQILLLKHYINHLHCMYLLHNC